MPRRYDDEVVCRAQDLRAMAYKYTEVQNKLKREFKVAPSYMTLHSWFKEGDRDRISLLESDLEFLQQRLNKITKALLDAGIKLP